MFIIIPGANVAVSDHDDNNHSEKGEERTQKLLESIAQVSDMASQQSGFVYDSTSGLYYDVQTGMYYDQVCASMCVFVCVCVCVITTTTTTTTTTIVIELFLL